ncbi:MAG: Gfo/Idh/MocA family oxidoreductase, partial [Flavobacteriaceae bacterium]
MKRKEFIQKSALVSGGGILSPNFSFLSSGSKIMGANDRIRVGAVGINGMGWADTKALMKLPGIELVAICDVDQNVLEKRKEEISKKGGNVQTYSDYRQLLDQKDIDVIVIGSPDHWHALMMIHASEAGKHVYVEKPIGNSIGECRAMCSPQEHYNHGV